MIEQMIEHSTIFYIVIGLMITSCFGLIFYSGYDNLTLNHWIPQTIIAGIIIIPLTVCGGIIDDNNTKVEKSIENTITANYDNVLNYHNEEDNKTFASSGSKYTFEYDEETKTLTVFTDTNSSVDAVFVDGVKQNDQKASDKTDKKKDCVSYKTDDTDKINSKSNADNNSSSTASSTAVSLQQKIQDKIQSRYNGVVITGFDTIKMSGTFSCDNVQYSFQWKDNTLEVINADDVTYYKVVQ